VSLVLLPTDKRIDPETNGFPRRLSLFAKGNAKIPGVA
jgi:hypothetical protein